MDDRRAINLRCPYRLISVSIYKCQCRHWHCHYHSQMVIYSRAICRMVSKMPPHTIDRVYYQRWRWPQHIPLRYRVIFLCSLGQIYQPNHDQYLTKFRSPRFRCRMQQVHCQSNAIKWQHRTVLRWQRWQHQLHDHWMRPMALLWPIR